MGSGEALYRNIFFRPIQKVELDTRRLTTYLFFSLLSTPHCPFPTPYSLLSTLRRRPRNPPRRPPRPRLQPQSRLHHQLIHHPRRG